MGTLALGTMVFAAAASALTADAGTAAAPDLQLPTLRRASPAHFPSDAVETGPLEVPLWLTVDAEGEVEEASVRTAVPGPFAREAVHAATRLEFNPARVNAQPVAVQFEYVYRFEPTQPPDAGAQQVTSDFQTVVRAESVRGDLGRVGLQGAELREVPGTGGDPFKAVMVLPGVSTMGSGIPFPVVRGSSPASTGFFLDGIRVPQLYHSFLGPAVINPNLIDGLDFYAGGAPTRYGGLLGGAVDARLMAPRGDGLHFSATADLLSASAFLEVPISQTGTSVTLAGRYSYTQPLLGLINRWLTPGERLVLDFWDYQARLEQQWLGGTLRVFALGSSDTFGTEHTGAAAQSTSTGTQTLRYQRADLRYQHPVGRSTAEVGFTVGEDRFDFLSQGPLHFDVPGLYGTSTQQTAIDQLTFSGRLRWWGRLSDSWRLSAGATVDRVSTTWGQSITNTVSSQQQPYTWNLRQPEAIGTWFGAWAEAGWAGPSHLSVTAGVRVDAFHQVTALQTAAPGEASATRATADPRLSASYQVSDALCVRASAGLYHQAPSFLVTLPVVDQSVASVGFQEVVQTSIGGTWKVWHRLELSADLYVNPMLRLLEYPLLDDERLNSVVDPFSPGSVSPADFGVPTQSTGLAYGADLMLRWPLTEHFFGWLTLSLQRSTRWQSYWLTDGQSFTATTSGQLPYAFDQTLVANAVLSYRFSNGVSVGTTLHFNTGRPESGQFGSRTHVPSSDGSQWVFVSRDQATRLPPYFRADLRVSKVWRTSPASIELFLDVLNVTVRQEATGFDYQGGNGQRLTRTAQSAPIIIPTLGLKVSN